MMEQGVKIVPKQHCAVIKAWADGHLIEWRQGPKGEWHEAVSPSWNPIVQYRVKPEKKTIGQLFYEVWYKSSLITNPSLWRDCSFKKDWEERAIDFLAMLKENNHVI